MALPDNPLTRNEHYLAKIAGQDVEIPEPITREDHYLHYISEHGGGLPEYTEADEGKTLKIVDGAPAWASIPAAAGEDF